MLRILVLFAVLLGFSSISIPNESNVPFCSESEYLGFSAQYLISEKYVRERTRRSRAAEQHRQIVMVMMSRCRLQMLGFAVDS